MAETYVEQRARILRANPEVSPFMFDSAVALGYAPESWDGMWKLPAEEMPIIWLTRRWALVHEIVYRGGTKRSIPTRRGGIKKRWVLRRTRD